MARRRNRSAKRKRKGQSGEANPPGHSQSHAENTSSGAEDRRSRLANKLLLTAAFLLQAAWMAFLLVAAMLD